MVYRSTMEVPTRYQWDADSRYPLPDPGTAPGNCGITAVTVAEMFYTDAWHGIYANRRMVTTSLEPSSTIGNQSQILWKRNVPNVIDKVSLTGLHNIMASRLRPVVVGLDFSKVPYDVAGHPFRGSHSIMLRANAANGFTYLDPNFNRTYRTDPKHGYRYMPDWVLQAAYYNVPTQWAIVPTKDKLIPALVTWAGRIRVASAGVTIRDSAKETAASAWARSRSDGYTYHLTNGERLFSNSYEYWWDGETVMGEGGIDYYRVKTHSGNVKFIRVGVAVIVRKA